MRFLIALLSLLLLAVCTVALVTTPDSAAASVLRGDSHKERSWWRFVVALFTGEVLYEAWKKVRGGGGEAELAVLTPCDALPPAATPDPAPAAATVVEAAVPEPAPPADT